ncbi:uncharacterized protein L203_104980 [Cryptococcus depauperatus CBS 7841]|uniref:Chitin-binding type-3 domain-containing protein n=1 Tax=Cryptococcus depauperatus CBS 7841 TaxID=1295531 RepID=A0AAJ8JWJ7_9TREE
MHIPDSSDTQPIFPPLQTNSFACPPTWGPYITYPPGAIVGYEGTLWRCEAIHTSGAESVGAPSNNPHLWTAVGVNAPPSYYAVPQHQGQIASPYYQSGAQSPICATSVNDEKAHVSEKGFAASLGGKVSENIREAIIWEEDRKAKDKDDLKDEVHGKKFWRAGGIGVWSYSQDREEEGKKGKVWKEWVCEHDRDDWLKVARERTKFYNEADNTHIRPLFCWKIVNPGERLPIDALPIGNEQDGAVLYAARAWCEGGIHLGKAGHHLLHGASVSYGGGEVTTDTYEVFCGPIHEPYLVKWMTFPHGQIARVEGWQPVEGGREIDGAALLLAKGFFENGQHPGKVMVNDDHACIGFGGGEVWVRPFQVLAYANPHRR